MDLGSGIRTVLRHIRDLGGGIIRDLAVGIGYWELGIRDRGLGSRVDD